MAQYGRPNSTIQWLGWSAVGAANREDCLNEVVPNEDVNYIRCVDAGPDTYECGLTNVVDPGVHTGHIFRFRFRRDAGLAQRCVAHFYQGALYIAQSGTIAATDNYQTVETTLTAVQAALITDYTDLRIWIISNNMGVGDTLRVTWVELEVPDAVIAPTVTTNPASGVT